MEQEEKELIEKLKDFDMTNLYGKGSYIDFLFQNCWTQGYIKKTRPNNKYDVVFMLGQGQIKILNDVPNKLFSFFGEYSHLHGFEPRGISFNQELYCMQSKQVIHLFNIKLKKLNIELNNETKNKKKKETKKEEDDSKTNNEQNQENNENKENLDNKENNKQENLNNDKENNKNFLENQNNDNKENNENNENTKFNDKENKENLSNNEETNNKNNNENKENEENIIINDQKETETSNSISETTNVSNSNSNNDKINNNPNKQEKSNNNIILTKLDKNGNQIDVTGYYTFQFLGGFLLDCLFYIFNDLGTIDSDNNLKELLSLCLDTIIYVSAIVKTNLNRIKSAMNKRKLTIVSQLYAMLASFELIIHNFANLYQYDFDSQNEIDEKLRLFANMCYMILLDSKDLNAFPLKFLVFLINFLTNENVKETLVEFNKEKVYNVFLSHIENLTENELKNIKNNEMIHNYCKYIVNKIYQQPRSFNINKCYYTYLINCLKCKNLEKKMNALNDINDIIFTLSRFENIDAMFYEFFINKNKILDFFFEESIHDEVLKRSGVIFKYLASYNKLSDDILEKLIQEQNNNEIIKHILCDVASELPSEKKQMILNHLTKNLNFDENKSDIDFVTKLTEACFNYSLNYYKEQLQQIQKIQQSNAKKLLANLENNKNNEDDENKNKNNENKNEEEKTPTDKKDENKKEEHQNYFGLTLLFDYIIKDFNEKKPFDKNNVNFAIEAFSHVLPLINNIETKDIFYFLDKLFDNILSNTKHNSVVQSLIMIYKLLDKFDDFKEGEEAIKKLDEKYNIITLLINDFIRYINILPKDTPINDHDIYEGIYPHYLNIEERLDLIFTFVKGEFTYYSLKINSKEHLEKLYKLLNDQKYKKELQKFLGILTHNLKFIDNETINDFFKDILMNENEFNINEFSDNSTINFIRESFYRINRDNKTIIDNGRMIKVLDTNIQGLNLMIDILIKNKNSVIQNKICILLSDLCLNLKDYKSDFPLKYWTFFIGKIQEIFEKLNDTKNMNGLKGIINLIDVIYTKCSNFDGPIPCKEDTHQVCEPCELFQFHCGTKKHKEYKIMVGKIDKIFDMRWKVGYYYDIQVNDVVFVDKEGNKYSFIDDDEYFFNIFPPEIYSNNKKFVLIKVLEVPGILLTIENNPKTLIEQNEEIFKILIKNLYEEKNLENESKKKIWNIIKKMPKIFYIKERILKFGETEKLSEDIIKQNFNYNEIYILTYSLECIDYFIKNNKEKKDNFLDNFINIQGGDKIIYNILLETKIQNDPIRFECIIDIINMIDIINQYKIEKEIVKNNYQDLIEIIGLDSLLKKLTDIIIEILKINFNDLNPRVSIANNYTRINDNETVVKLLEILIKFIDEVNSSNNYLKFLLANENLFKEIFLFNYINCKEKQFIEILHNYFMKNIFEDQNLIKIYSEIMLTPEVFNYLIDKDINGNYFEMLASVMKKYSIKNKEKKYSIDLNENNKQNETDENINNSEENKSLNISNFSIEEKCVDQFKIIIDLILNYIENQSDKEITKEDVMSLPPNPNKINKNIENKKEIISQKFNINTELLFENNKIERIISFLQSILNLYPEELVPFLSEKIDILDLFLNKSILRKCVLNPLDTKESLCKANNSQDAVFQLIIFILRNINQNNRNIKNNDLYSKIIDKLDKYHSIGFWKKNTIKNWELESHKFFKQKFTGLRNMSATCYMNSIIQQIFMIPMLRETLLSIKNTKTDNVLFQLQLLFSSLKIYESQYYDPKSFVIANGLSFYEQMDADEYFGMFIDKIENDIKNLYPEKNGENPYKELFRFFFGIKALDELKFEDCGHKRYNEFFYNSIQLEVKGFNNIYNSLKNYFKTEIMDGENKINCEECNMKRTCHKRQIFKSLPNILIINLKRFEFDYNTMLKYKLNNYFEFPFELDMKNYLIENNNEKNTIYELTGITIHFGVSDFGHYYDLIKSPNDSKWYKFNDNFVHEFPVEEIPHEAFGEREIEDDFNKDNEEKESGKNNAYILIYKKKNFDKDTLENLSQNYKCSLATPPYSKMSNINDLMKSLINNQMFKFWTLQNILAPSYQNFIVNLLKIDLVKNISSKSETSHTTLYKMLKNDGYLISNEEISQKTNDIFLFGLKYFCNVMLRIMKQQKEKSLISIFAEILKVYIENDISKAKYVLEEFSNEEIIFEYLVYCPNGNSCLQCYELILTSFKKIYDELKINRESESNSNDENKEFIYKFINTYVLFISRNINKIAIEFVNNIFLKIIKIDDIYIKYLKYKKLDRWIYSFYNEEEDDDDEEEAILNTILTETEFPKIISNHKILAEKTMMFNGTKIDDIKGIEKDSSCDFDHQLMNKLKDASGNLKLIKFLFDCFQNIE